MKKRTLSLLLTLCLCISLLATTSLAAGAPTVSGSYANGVVTVTGSGFSGNTSYNMIAVKDASDKLIALGNATTDEAGALSTAITTGAISTPATCKVYVYNNIGGTVAASGAVSTTDVPTTKHTITASAGTGGTISPSGSVSVVAGTNQTFTITANSGYSISSVTVDGKSVGVVGTYTFDNVTANHTIAATFSSSGGSSGGGGGGGGGSSSTSTTSKPSTSGNTTSVSTETKATMSGSTASAAVSEKAMNAAIDSAITAATKANGNANVTVAVEAAKDAKAVKASIPAASMTKLAENKIEASLTVETGLGTIAMDSRVVDTISKQANGKPVSVEIAKVDNKTLSAGQQAIVGDRPVIDLSIVADGKNVSQLGGSATISIPYTPANGEDTSKMVVWYLADNGDLTLIDCSYSNGKLSFSTDHFSKYVLASFTFTDAKGGEWYYSAVKTMQDKGLMNGMTSDLFGANETTNRAMIATMLYRLAGQPTASGDCQFADVMMQMYYGPAVSWATEKGILKGMSANQFAPNSNVTREQIVTILYRYAGAPAVNSAELNKFADATSVSAYAKDAFAWAIANGVIKGDNYGRLNATTGATRAEVATIFANYLNVGK